MRKLVLMAVALMLPAAASAQIAGSAHDFSGDAWNTTGQICIVCHAPHNTSGTVANAPLWNHEVSTQTFTVYTNTGTLDATDVSQPSGASMLCLSCHDGVTALDAFGGNTGTQPMTGTAVVGTDLSNDHPVSFTYDAALATADGGLADPTNVASGLGGNIDADMLFGPGNDQLECASCHGVHNDSGLAFLLRKANTGSDLCLTCHTK